MKSGDSARKLLTHWYRQIYIRMQRLNAMAERGLDPARRSLENAGRLGRETVGALTPQTLRFSSEPLEPRLFLSVTAALSGATVTFNDDSNPTAGTVHLASTAGGLLEYSTDGGMTWSTDMDSSTAGTQTLTLSAGVTVTSHAAAGVVLDSISTSGGDLTIQSDNSITTDPSAVVSTRQISSGNPAAVPSTGNSGTVNLSGNMIGVAATSSILTYADSGFTGGTITLDASDSTGLSGLGVLDEQETSASLSVDGTLHGADTTLTTDGNSAWTFSDGSTPTNAIVNQLTTTAFLAGVAIAKANSTIEVGGTITANNLTVNSQAETMAAVTALSMFTPVAAAYGETDPTATVTIGSGATINASGNAMITTNTTDKLDIEAKENLFPARGASINVTAAVAESTVVSTINSTGDLNVGGNLDLHAIDTKTSDVESSAGAYADGMAGIGVALSFESSDTEANLGGTAIAGGAVRALADSNTIMDKTIGSAQVGNGKVSGAIIGATGAITGAISGFFGSKTSNLDPRSGAQPIAVSGAVAYAQDTNDATATIQPDAIVHSTGGSVYVLANIIDHPQIATIAMVDSQAYDMAEGMPQSGLSKDNSIAAAVNVGDFENTANAYIGKDAQVTAANSVTVNATTVVPQYDQWAQIHGIGDVVSKLNSNLGVQNGFFTSWSQANANGQDTTFAGSVTVVTIKNTSNSYIDSGATVTQDRKTAPASFSFDPATALDVNGVLTLPPGYGLRTGDQVVYENNGNPDIPGLSNGQTYYLIVNPMGGIHFAGSLDGALAGNPINTNGYSSPPGTMVKLIVRQGVFVTSYAESQSINFAGGISIGQLFNILKTIFGTPNPPPSEAGVGGSYLGMTQNATATSQIRSGATVTGYAVEVTSDTVNNNIAIAEAGGAGGMLAIFGSFAIENTTDTAIAQIESGAMVYANGVISPDPTYTNKNLLVHAQDNAQIYTFAGAFGSGQKAAIGVSLAINNITRTTESLLGGGDATDSSTPPLTSAATPTGTINTNGNLGLEAYGTGQILSVSLAGSYTSPASTGGTNENSSQPDDTQAAPEGEADGDDGNGPEGQPNPGPQPNPSDEGQPASDADGEDEEDFGLSVSGDIALNTIMSTTIAEIHNANVTSAATAAASTNATASDDSQIIAAAGSVAISTNSQSVGIAGSYTENDVTAVTEALVVSSTLVNAGALVLYAHGDEEIDAGSASGSGSPNGVNVAGQVNINNVGGAVEAGIEGDSSVTMTPSVTITALGEPSIFAISGAVAYGGMAGIGASVALNTVNTATTAVVSDSDVATSGSLDVSATNNPNIIAAAAAVGASPDGLAAAVSVSINTIDDDSGTPGGAFAEISGELTNGVSADSGVTLTSNDTSSILSVAGALGVGSDAGFGVSVANNMIGSVINSFIDGGATVTSADGSVSLMAGATSTALIETIAAGGAGAGTFALGGSITLNYLTETIAAYVSGGSTVAGESGVTIGVTNEPTIEALAGEVSGAGEAAIGAAIAANDIGGSAEAYIDGSSVGSSTAGLNVTVSSSAEIEALSAGVSGAGTATLTGAVSVNQIYQTLDSHISNDSIVIANGDVTFSTTDTSTIKSLSGQIGGAGAAAIGGAASYNDIANTLNADGSGSTITAHAGSVYFTGNEGSTIGTIAAGGSLGGIAAVAGSVAINMLANAVNAYVADSMVTADNNLGVLAVNTGSITSYVGTLAGSFAVGVGASVAVNITDNQTNAYVNKSTIQADAIGAGSAVLGWDPATGNQTSSTLAGVSIVASDGETFKNYVVAGAISGAVSVGVNAVDNTVNDVTLAYIDNSAVNSSSETAGIVYVRAHQGTTVNDYGGAISASLGVGVGAAVDTTQFGNTTKAYIADSNSTTPTTVYGGDVEVNSLTRENVTAYIAGLGVGLAATGVAGTAGGIVSNSTNEAYISDSKVYSTSGLRVLANDGATATIYAGSLAAGDFFGGGGSIILVSLNDDTVAYMTGVVTDAMDTTQVEADSTESVTSYAGTGAAGGVCAIAGAIIVAGTNATTLAFIDSDTANSINSSVNQNSAYKTSSQNVVVKASDNATVTNGAGTLSLSLVDGGGAAVSVPTVDNTVNAFIGDNSTVSAEENVEVTAGSISNVTSNAVAMSAAGEYDINGAFSLGGIGDGIPSDGAALVVGDLAGAISGALGRSGGVPGLGSDPEAAKAQALSTSTSFTGSGGLSTAAPTTPYTTAAWIGKSAVVTATDGNLDVTATSSVTAEIGAGGITIGLIVGVGGSVAEIDVSNATLAYIDNSAQVTAGQEIQVTTDADQIAPTVEAVAGSGGIIGLGAAVARSWVNENSQAYLGTDVMAKAGASFLLSAKSNTDTNSTADALVVGVVSGASTDADGYISADSTLANVGNGSTVMAGTDAEVYAGSINAITSNATGGSGGLLSGGGAESTAEIDGYDTEADLGTSVTINAFGGTFNQIAENTATLNSTAGQTLIAGVAVNYTEGTAKIDIGLTKANVGADTTINAENVNITATDLAFYLNASADASVPFNLGGANEADTDANASTDALTHIATGVTINGATSVTIKADILSGQFISNASTSTTGVTGTLTSNATSDKDTYATVNADNGSTINTQTVTVESSVPYTQTDHYTKTATTNAQTVTHYIVEVIGTVCNVVGQVVCGWGLFCNPTTVCTDITETVAEVLDASTDTSTPGTENMLNTVNFNSAVNIAGGNDPTLIVDPTGKITQMSGVTATDGTNPLHVGDTVSTGVIVVNSVQNQSPGLVDISAPNGETEGHSDIDFPTSFGEVNIQNASTNQLQIDAIGVINTSTPATVEAVSSMFLGNWTYTLATNTALTSTVNIDSTNSAAGDITIEGEISNPLGTVDIHNAGGNILDAGPTADINATSVGLEADQGSLGTTVTPVYLTMVVTSGPGNGITQATGDQGVNLNITPHAEEMVTDVSFELNNISSADGSVNIQVNDALELEEETETQVTLVGGQTVTGVPLTDYVDPSTAVNNTTGAITFGYAQGLNTGDEVTYTDNGGTPIDGLISGASYHVIYVSPTTYKLGETFDASGAVNTATNTIGFATDHDLHEGDQVIYNADAGTPIGGLTNGDPYYVHVVDAQTIELFTDSALTMPAMLTSPGVGTQSLSLDINNSTATGVHHQFYSNSFYVQTAPTTIVRVLTSDIATLPDNQPNPIYGAVLTPAPYDSTIVLDNISASGDVTINVGDSTLVETDVVLDGTLSAGGMASITAVSGSITSSGDMPSMTTVLGDYATSAMGQVVSGKNITLSAVNGSIGASGAPIYIVVGSGVVNAAANGDVYLEQTSGAMNIGTISSATGNVSLTVDDAAGPGNDLDVGNGDSVKAMEGNVSLLAGDNVQLAFGSVVSSMGTLTIIGNENNVDMGVPTTIDLAGTMAAGTISIKGTTSGDTVDLDPQSLTGPTTIMAGLGNDIINVGGTGLSTGGVLDGIHSEVYITGSLGDTLDVDDTGATKAKTGILTSTTLSVAAPSKPAVVISYGSVIKLNITLGSLGNTFTIKSTAANLSTHLNSGAGADTINVQTTNASSTTNVNTGGGVNLNTVKIGSLAPLINGIVDNIKGAVIVTGNTYDTMNVDDTGSAGLKTTGLLTPTKLTGLNMGSGGITYSGLAYLNINLGKGGPLVAKGPTGNTFTINGINPLTTTTVDGGISANDTVKATFAGDFNGTLFLPHFEHGTINVGGNLNGTLNTQPGHLELLHVVGSVTAAGIVSVGAIDTVTVGVDLAGSFSATGNVGLLSIGRDMTGTATVTVVNPSAPTSANINTMTVGRNLAGAVQVSGTLGVLKVGGSDAAIVTESGTMTLVTIGGNLTVTGVIDAINANPTLGNINTMTIGQDLDGTVHVSGALATLKVTGFDSGLVTETGAIKLLTISGNLTSTGEIDAVNANPSLGNISALTISMNLAGTVHVSGALSTLTVGGDDSGLVTEAGTIKLLTIKGNLTSTGVIDAVNSNPSLGNINALAIGKNLAGAVSVSGALGSAAIGGDLSGKLTVGGAATTVSVGGNLSGALVVAGKLGSLTFGGNDTGTINAGSVGAVAGLNDAAGIGGVVLSITQAGILRQLIATDTLGNSLSNATFKLLYDGSSIADPQLAVRVANTGKTRFDLLLTSPVGSNFDLSRLDSASGAANLRDVVVEGNILPKISAPQAKFFGLAAGTVGGVYLPADAIGDVAAWGNMAAGVIRVASIEGIAFSTMTLGTTIYQATSLTTENSEDVLLKALALNPATKKDYEAVALPTETLKVAFSAKAPVALFVDGTNGQDDKPGENPTTNNGDFEEHGMQFTDQLPSSTAPITGLATFSSNTARHTTDVTQLSFIGNGASVDSTVGIANISSTGPLGDLLLRGNGVGSVAKIPLQSIVAPSMFGTLDLFGGTYVI